MYHSGAPKPSYSYHLPYRIDLYRVEGSLPRGVRPRGCVPRGSRIIFHLSLPWGHCDPKPDNRLERAWGAEFGRAWRREGETPLRNGHGRAPASETQ